MAQGPKRRQPKTGGYVLLKALVTPALKHKAERRAARERISVAALLATALESYLAEPAGFDLPAGDERIAEIEAKLEQIMKGRK